MDILVIKKNFVNLQKQLGSVQYKVDALISWCFFFRLFLYNVKTIKKKESMRIETS